VSAESSDLSDRFAIITPGAATEGKMYGLSFGYSDIDNKVTYKLTNGNQSWTQVYEAYTANDGAIGEAARTVVFDNGLTLITTATNDETAPPQGIEFANVVGGTSTKMSFQVGAEVDTSMTIDFQATTSTLLGLNGTSLNNTTNAQNASKKIEQALTQINNMIADFGGKKSQLSFQSQALSLQIQNETAAKATFMDADIAAALQDSTQFQALTSMASSVFGNILKEPDKLATLVQQTIR
jgi:flagellin